ncbi:MAG TPA: hypothetical protein VK158_03785, partial [Acidobacteriota bacterium]|nr:hypothetical protein [Acidobacteriota bacterium]
MLFFLSFFALATVVLVSNAVHADIGDLCDPSGSACSAGDCQDTDGNGVGMCRDFVGTGESCNDNTIKCDSGYCDAGTCVDSFPPTPGDGQIGDYCDAGDGCAVGTCQDTDGNGVGACRDFVADGQSCDDIYVKCADGVCMSGTCVGTPSDPTCQSDYDFCMSNGKTCGTFSGTDDCASPRTVDCSLATGISCTSPNTCTNNVCVAPPTCTYPGDAVFCSSQGKTCGTFTGFNICLNTTITVDCSAALGTNCTSPYFCNENNVCALPDCVNETNAAFCSRLGKTCGIFSGTDNCGNNRQVNCTTATSTSCSSPNSCTDNVCTPEACASRDTVGGTYTSYSSYTVPGGTTSLQIKLWGAGGYGETTANSGRGGGGGYITSHFAVQPGDVIQIGISNGSRNSCSIANITRGGILVGQVVAGSGGSAGDNTGPVSAYLEPLGGGGGGYIGSSGQDG